MYIWWNSLGINFCGDVNTCKGRWYHKLENSLEKNIFQNTKLVSWVQV